ncbi:MAG: hypothetical protein Q8Q08_06345 [Candidatus Omnitrophota bacterium]|nr:hypothetical protein [Candidatus Omnitrophota bacterium]MDZ4242157.1 hypothetical protein [Candidatus Omnitrophota bacterium]
MKTNRWLMPLLVASAGVLILLHHITYQPALSQGDHGRDLYAAAASLRGDVPYRDYWWVYGPLMPSYYGLFFKFFGMTVPSILLGKLVLNVLSGVLCYLALSALMAPLWAFLGALWFWSFQPDFFFTYNHAGGITMITAVIAALFSYLAGGKVRFLWLGLTAIFILGLIKVNFGLCALFSFSASVFVIDRIQGYAKPSGRKLFYLTALGFLPLAFFAVYTLLLQGLPLYYIRQCLPYLRSDHPYHMAFLDVVRLWIDGTWMNMNISWPNRFFGVLILAATLQSAALVSQKAVERRTVLAAGILVFFYVTHLHEFLDGGVFYRTFWSKPFSILLTFLVLETAFRRMASAVKVLLFGTLLLAVALNLFEQIDIIRAKKLPEQYLAHPRAEVITGNAPQWIDTVQRTTGYLETHLKKDETFFALPYDVIYYYLSGRASPTRQLIFFEHINITPEQEKDIIAGLEAKGVRTIVLSSRMRVRIEGGMGIFGETHCPLLWQYIQTHYKPAAQFGDWVNEPGWAWNHGTVVLEKTGE